MTVQALAAKAAAEIRRRGWASGDLSIEREEWLDERGRYIGPDFDTDEYQQNCKVCVLGGGGAAAYGTPQRGYDLDDPTYHSLLIEMANRVRPDWDDDDFRRGDVVSVVYEWNDNQASDAPVLALLGDIAAGR